MTSITRVRPARTREKYEAAMFKYGEVQTKLAAAGIQPTEKEYLKQLSPERRQKLTGYADNTDVIPLEDDYLTKCIITSFDIHDAMVADGWSKPDPLTPDEIAAAHRKPEIIVWHCPSTGCLFETTYDEYVKGLTDEERKEFEKRFSNNEVEKPAEVEVEDLVAALEELPVLMPG